MWWGSGVTAQSTETSPTITTVVFDLGQVLVGWDPRRIWARDLTEEEIEAFLVESAFATLNHSLDAGRPYTEARTELAKRAPHHVATLDAYWNAIPDSLTGPVPGSAEIVSEIADLGLRLLGLTNWSAETFHHAPVAAPAISLLEDVLVSGREGLAKPDPAIFELLVQRYDLTPAETFFTDDSPANIEAARSLGLQVHLFAGADGLRSALRAHGVEIAAGS